ncbi:unnamed protein product [Adineta steineri]|uniref:Uncharacterized protein n=1 Tax=Adineta steineri TaxID=433720 RepID=A0A815MST4_9BILA|nr:unnamed protein product [Adineta steineri]CAF1623696.1 unnamed protein product [Adineta steineri]
MLTITTTEPPKTKPIEPSKTTTTTEPSKTKTIEPSRTTTTIKPLSANLPALISLDSIDGAIYGVHDTRINQDSQASAPGNWAGTYHPSTPPTNACDGDTSTKYLHFGRCTEYENDITCGLDTGFYLELKRGTSLVTGLQICTADDFPERDPLTVSLEGSNQSGAALTLGSSWTLIYKGDSGLGIDTDRLTCGIMQLINNPIQYKSYRFLVSSKRDYRNSVQYSEVKLFGY